MKSILIVEDDRALGDGLCLALRSPELEPVLCRSLSAARNALALERNNFAAVQLKHSQGNLSESAVAEAEDKVKQAQEAVDSALIELFASYRSYRWAVDYGILNT